jgi:hypothetical protein
MMRRISQSLQEIAAPAADSIRAGSWLTRSRLRGYPAMLLAGFAGVLIWLAVGGGSNPWNAADFVGFWAPATLAADGRASTIYDPVVLHRLQESITGVSHDYQNWPYPPIYLLVILPLGFVPFWWAFVIWEGAGLLVYWLAARALAGRAGLLLALAFPGVWIGILNGHAEFLLAGLLGAAVLRLERSPYTAGILIALCAIKPHLFLLVPIALMAGGQWRAVLAACITIAALVAGSLAAFGPEPWLGFFREATGIGGAIGSAQQGFYEIAIKQQSAFAYGASIGGLKLGLILQALVTAIAALIVALVWRSQPALEIRVAVLCCATLLATPYLFDYDLALLAVPIALVARRGLQDGFRAWEKSLLAALWLLPLIARTASLYHLPVTLILFGLSLAVFAAPALPWKTASAKRTALPVEPGRVNPRLRASPRIGS